MEGRISFGIPSEIPRMNTCRMHDRIHSEFLSLGIAYTMKFGIVLEPFFYPFRNRGRNSFRNPAGTH